MARQVMIEPEFAPWQWVALNQPFAHFGMFNGVATGKTFTGSQFALDHILNMPHVTGFIGANTYDQMNQATLRELFHWLDEYEIEYVIDRQPPKHWGAKKFKKYNNILTTYASNVPTTIFTRVLQDGNPLRGIEFSWYWIDETRDTPEGTHDIILSRLRESDYVKGLVTTTTAGEDWAYKRFVKKDEKSRKHPYLYGSMHVPTIKSVEYGIITQQFYDGLEASYSEMMALQELWAKHVNVGSGRAYHTASEVNKRIVAPWGDMYPSDQRPLIVGCDFNFSPAPCVWMIGQIGPPLVDPKTGMLFSDMIHWFGEISIVEASTPEMTRTLMSRYPGHFYEIYGDASGNKGTTSNAGEYDYAQMRGELTDHGCVFTINVDQSNPVVRNRIENMNMLFKNVRGQVRQTYNPVTCPLFDEDCRQVGWKASAQITGKGKLDNAGNVNLTHATDGAGYAVYKKFPPGMRAYNISSNQSVVQREVSAALGSKEDDF